MTPIEVLLVLIAGHYFCDFSLQSDAIAKGKNRHSGPPPGYDPEVHGRMQKVWPHYLTAHAAVHGLFVGVVVGPLFGAAEFAMHWAIDFIKCERVYGIHTDQALHIACKVAWVIGWALT